MKKFKVLQLLIGILIGYLIFRPEPVKLMPAPGVSESMPLMDQKGREASNLSKLRGKVVLVSFWATWCEPCKKEIPELVKLKEKFPQEEFQVLLINEDEERDKVFPFLDELKISTESLLIYFDHDFKNASKFGVEVLPTSILLDKHGKNIFSAQGYIDWLTPERIKEIEKLLSPKS